jgi:hypothetical protein
MLTVRASAHRGAAPQAAQLSQPARRHVRLPRARRIDQLLRGLVQRRIEVVRLLHVGRHISTSTGSFCGKCAGTVLQEQSLTRRRHAPHLCPLGPARVRPHLYDAECCVSMVGTCSRCMHGGLPSESVQPAGRGWDAQQCEAECAQPPCPLQLHVASEPKTGIMCNTHSY